MRVAERRQGLIRAVIGAEGEAEMRLTRFPAADLRKDPAAALDAIRAQGFFPGARAVLIEEAGDAAAPALAPALSDWAEGDAFMVVTAGALPASSKLRKLFEGDKRALALAVYDDPPGQAEIAAMLQAEGLGNIPGEAMRDLTALAQVLEPGDFRQTLQRIALYKLGDAAPLTVEEIAAPARPISGTTLTPNPICAPNSASICRHMPHGVTGRSPAATAIAVNLRSPALTAAVSAARSAHIEHP